MLTVGGLFSGIGGLELGFLRNKFNLNFVVENDPFCKTVLQANLGAKNLNDVVRVDQYPKCDVLLGGFPCQDISIAVANGHGLKGKRSNLFFEFMRAIDSSGAKACVIENVPRLLKSNNGEDIETVLDELYDRFENVEIGKLNSIHFGVPQKRERLFIIGHSGGSSTESVLSYSRSIVGYRHPLSTQRRASAPGTNTVALRKSRRAQTRHDNETWVADTKTNTLNVFDCGKTRTTTLVSDNRGVRSLTPIEHERLQGFPDNWTLNKNSTDNKRCKALGNAVTVPIAEWIAQGIKEIYEQH